MIQPEAVGQYLIHPALRERLETWLQAEGFVIDPMPHARHDDKLVTLLVSPGEDLMRQA